MSDLLCFSHRVLLTSELIGGSLSGRYGIASAAAVGMGTRCCARTSFRRESAGAQSARNWDCVGRRCSRPPVPMLSLECRRAFHSCYYSINGAGRDDNQSCTLTFEKTRGPKKISQIRKRSKRLCSTIIVALAVVIYML